MVLADLKVLDFLMKSTPDVDDWGHVLLSFHYISTLQTDLVCTGKALAGGFPISACLGTAEVMDAWGASQGEAIHTQTFLGNPLGCAMALAALDELEKLQPRVTENSQWLQQEMTIRGFKYRGQGMLWGIELDNTLKISRLMMERGFIVLPAGPNCEVLALTPPMSYWPQLTAFLDALVGISKHE